MPQVRIEKSDHFTRIDNDLIQNPEISLKAKGLLAYMLSLPDDWDYSISGLSAKCKEGKSSIRSAIAELMEYRYITRTLMRDGDGRLDGYEYVVYEEPQPLCENPTTDNQSPENRTQQTTNSTNEEEKDPPYSPPTGGSAPSDPKTGAPIEAQRSGFDGERRHSGADELSPQGEARDAQLVPTKDKPAPKAGRTARREKSMPDHDPEAFEIFWEAYPRKDGRKAAVRAWDKLKPDRALCRAMYVALKFQRGCAQWAEEAGKFIPHFSTWLNGRKWEDQGVDLSLLDRARSRPGVVYDPEVPS